MSLFKRDAVIPGGLHPSGLVVVAVIFVVGYFMWTRRTPPSGGGGGGGFTSADMGSNQSVRPMGWSGDSFQPEVYEDDDDRRENHFRAVVASREPAYHQPVVIEQGGERTPWYRFIDRNNYAGQNRRKPYLEKRVFP